MPHKKPSYNSSPGAVSTYSNPHFTVAVIHVYVAGEVILKLKFIYHTAVFSGLLV